MHIRLEAICEALREKQRDSRHPKDFEKELCLAFNALQIDAKHLGGSNEPDIILHICNGRVTIDAKTKKEGVIAENRVNFDAMERYRENDQPIATAVIAPGFSTGNIRDTARKKGIVLIETEAICKLLQNHKIYPYNEEGIYNNLFNVSREVIMPEDISPSTAQQESKLEIIQQIFGLKDIRTFTLYNLKFLLQAHGIASTDANLQEVLEFLGEAPLNILVEAQDEYSFTTDLDTIKKRLGLVFTALGFERHQPTVVGPGDGGKVCPGVKVTAGEFVHEGGGIYHWAKDAQIRIDANKGGPEVEQSLANNGLTIANLSSFYYALRKEAGLLQKRK